MSSHTSAHPSNRPASPRDLGYRFPAEWEPHAAVWLAWPHDPVSFPYLDKAEAAFADFIHAVHDCERVELLVRDADMQSHATQLLQARRTELGAIRFHLADYADIWFRDYGPIFVANRHEKRLAMTKWVFNAWGNKYGTLLKDNQVPYFMNQSLQLPVFETGIVLEGGSIDGNGRGTILTTEQCLLNPNRNPHLTKKQIEQYLADYLGARHVIWLNRGIEGDDTDGHIDDIARFVDPSTVVCAYQEDAGDAEGVALKENLEILQKSKDQDGKPLRVVRLPVPGWVGDKEGRLPASYANFYIANGKVLVPLFGTKADQHALAVIQSVFHGRKVVGIPALYLVYGLGTFHCMTQQQPST
jgi:agmatine deiminase